MGRYRRIRNRADDAVARVADSRMSRDLPALLGAIAELHQRLAQQAAARAVRQVEESRAGERRTPSH